MRTSTREWLGGMVGFDDDNNIYVADETFHRIARYKLPYTLRTIIHNGQPTPALPATNGGLLPGARPSAASAPPTRLQTVWGLFSLGDQWILRDYQRYVSYGTAARPREDTAGLRTHSVRSRMTDGRLIAGTICLLGLWHAIDSHEWPLGDWRTRQTHGI